MSTFGFYPEFPQVAGVGNPSAGFARLYLHEDGTVRRRNSDGSETILQAGASGGNSLATGDFFLGDGSDGDVTISSNTTLTRSMFYENLTINAGATLTTAGNYIYVRNNLVVNGLISANGGNGGNGTAIGTTGIGGGGIGGVGGGIGGSGGVNGGAGHSTGNGQVQAQIGNMSSLSNSFGGAGGRGGSGALRASSLVGSVSLPSVLSRAYVNTFWFLSRISAFNATSPAFGGGGGTGGGVEIVRNASNGCGAGGGGGGGGAVFITAKNITGTGNIQARGGNGGNAINLSSIINDPDGRIGGALCGGGGGGGGSIVIGTSTIPTSINNTTGVGNIGGVSLSVEGGIGGLDSQRPSFPAENGANGQPGTIIIVR